VGLSHLGIVSGIGWASFGRPVVAVDASAHTVARLAHGDLPVREPGLPELLARTGDHIRFSSDFAALGACPIVVFATDVPTDENNRSDIAPILAGIDQALPHLRQGVTIVVMSQVPPGFTRQLGLRIQAARPGFAFQLYYQVETLIFGDAVRRCLSPERFIVGCADPRAPLPAGWRAGLEAFGCPICPMSYESAELTKTAINLYLISTVTYANAMADLCERIGADWSEVVPALRLDRRIGPAAYLQPGLGIAGGNLERDLVTLRTLGRQRGVELHLLDALARANELRFTWLMRKLDSHVFARVPRPTIALWGLTYKKNTHSIKNSPALRLLPLIESRASVRSWDPALCDAHPQAHASAVHDPYDAVDQADALVVMNDWDEFGGCDLALLKRKLRRPTVIDCAGVLLPRRSELVGFDYVVMGDGVTGQNGAATG
jgi:UDPglucose 6-dehydrogenase